MTYWKPIAALLLVVLLVGGGFYAGHHLASVAYKAQIVAQKAADAEALAKAEQAARAKEQLAADALAHIQAQNEQDKADAQAQYEKDVADLRSGALRLRSQWRCPAASVPGTPSGSGQPDAGADQRNTDAANLVRLAAEADAAIKSLQDIVKADRGMK